VKRTGMPERTTPLERHAGLSRSVPLQRGGPLRPVSGRRAADNRARRKVVGQLYGGERPACVRPGCWRLADDVHEPLTRARGGSITDPENMAALCRPCHDEVTFKPTSELSWAYEAGLLVHSWDGSAGHG
jgi:5-methylcytosine-specific restriction endonuclease McrA